MVVGKGLFQCSVCQLLIGPFAFHNKQRFIICIIGEYVESFGLSVYRYPCFHCQSSFGIIVMIDKHMDKVLSYPFLRSKTDILFSYYVENLFLFLVLHNVQGTGRQF